MIGIIGMKKGMTSYFNESGQQIQCTVIEAGPCHVTHVKTEETDGYNAVQLAFHDKKDKSVSAGMKGHFKRAGVSPKRELVEFRDFDLEANLGDTVEADIFDEGDLVSVVGTSKGKGFQGVVKRYNFRGVGDATHGQHNRQRAPGAIGMASTPSKVLKGQRMAGRTGGRRVTIQNLEIAKIIKDKNLILIKGAVPGHKGSYVIIHQK